MYLIIYKVNQNLNSKENLSKQFTRNLFLDLKHEN